MTRQKRQFMRQGVADLPTRTAVDAYVGAPGEPIFDGDTLRMHDGTTPGGIPLVPRTKATRSIYDYGLKPGATDITAALAALRAGSDNPVVYIPEGIYTASSPPEAAQYFHRNVCFVGAGRGRTVIKLIGDSWNKPLFSWIGCDDVGARDLTINVNGVPADPTISPNLAAVIQTANVKWASFDNVEIVGLKGDRILGYFALKTQHARVTNCRFEFIDNPRGATGGILTDNSYFGADIVASVAGTTMRVTKNGGRGAPEGLYEGLHLQGKGVPLNAHIVRQISSSVAGSNGTPIMGREGAYEISHAANVPAGTPINGVACDDWVVRGSVFRHCILSFQATRAVSDSNVFDGWGSGSAIIFDSFAAGGKSIDDRFRDGNLQADGTYLSDENLIWGDCLEVHGDWVQAVNPDAENIGGALMGCTSDYVRLTGGRIRKYAQASIHDTDITASTAGDKLTVTAVASSLGLVIKGQFITGPGIPAGTRIRSEDGNNTFTLDRTVTASATSQTFSVAAPIVGAAVNLQQASGLGTSTGTKITGLDIAGSGTPGEKYGVVDQDGTTGAGAVIANTTVSGVSVAPYRIVGKTIVVHPGTALTPAQLGAIAPNKGTVLGATGIGLTPAGVVSGSGTISAVVFGGGGQFTAPVVPAATATGGTEYVPTFTPNTGSATGLTVNRAAYKVTGKTVYIQMRFTLPAGFLPNYMSISAPAGVKFRDIGTGAFKNVSAGGGGFVHNPNDSTLQMDDKGALTSGCMVSLSFSCELQ